MEIGWFVALEIVWVVALAIWIVLEKRPAASTLAWIFGLAFLPVAGAFVYYLIGPRRLQRRGARYRQELERLFPRGAPWAAPRELSRDIGRQVRLAVGAGEAPLLEAERWQLFTEGAPCFAALGEQIAGARHHVHLESYIWEAGRTASELLARLVERARAGVEVRLLLDGVGAAGARRSDFAELRAAGGEVEFFNPPRLGLVRTRFLNFRSHRKIAVIDGRVALTGGMNVSDRQTTGVAGSPPWRDTQILLTGWAVHGLQAVFVANWGSTCSRPLAGDAYYPTPASSGRGTPAQVLASGPDRAVYPIHELLVSAISAADDRVWITTPYFVPDEPLVAALRTAAHRGVDVRLLLPRRSDSRFVDAAMRSFYEELGASGARIFEYRPRLLHAKTALIDDELALVGTANLDNRSFRLNFEVAVALYGPQPAAALAAAFARDLRDAGEVPRDRVRTLGFPRRLGEAAARLFAPVL
ncbi:MAG: cardiolipin synthase [Thermoanaerobaculia bacterium]|nr:cardiolipin synthase [Thermoanaerobaculia bacterium]